MAESIDALAAHYLRTEDDLSILGKQLESASCKTAVVFVDLVGSTGLKHAVSVPRWLGYVLRFLQAAADVAAHAGGTIVKRIGDELMLTFPTAEEANGFIAVLLADPRLAHHAFKAAADWGDAYHLTFADGGARDPYGPMVDRAARIAKLARGGSCLVSAQFVEQLRDRSSFTSLGRVPLKGVSEPVELLLRASDREVATAYAETLLKTLNSEDTLKPRFRYVARRFAVSDLTRGDWASAHPFLARELLALPMLPYTFDAFVELIRRDATVAREFVGHVVEWDARFHGASRGMFRDNIRVQFVPPSSARGGLMVAYCPVEMAEAVSAFSQGERVRVRGVLFRSWVSNLSGLCRYPTGRLTSS